MRVIARNTFVTFWQKHSGSQASLTHWLEVCRDAKWQSVGDVQAAFSTAKALNGERVRFEVAGGDFRLVVAFDFRRGIAFVKFLGSPAEYDRIDALAVSLF